MSYSALSLSVMKFRILLAITFSVPLLASAQFIAYNDHRPSGTTSPNATGYDMITNAAAQPLKDFGSGSFVGASLIVSHTGTPDDFGGNNYPNAGTPAYNLFNGIVDVGNAGIPGIRNSSSTSVTLTFTNLNPANRYKFRGASVRGNNYVDRWSVYSLQGVDAFLDAHVDASANNNLITIDEFPTATLTNGQVALNSGENREGSLVGWDEISPGADGVFSIRAEQYMGPTPFGNTANAATVYGYGFTAIYLEEMIGQVDPIVITNQPQSAIVPERSSFTFRVGASGTPIRYFWFRDGVLVPGVNSPTFNIASATYPTDNGARFFAILSNSLTVVTSSVVTLTVQQDLTPPTVIRAVADTDPSKVNLTFSEPMDAATLGESSFILYETGTDPFASPYISLTTVLTDGTNLVVNTDPRLPDVNYSILLLDVRDASSGNNLINPNPTEVKLLTTIELVGFTNNNVWKWTAETNLFGTGWETVGYDDSNPAVWPEGPAGLGNDGDNVLPLLTPTAYAVNSAPQFFRRHFNFPGLTSGAELRMRYSFEDGAVVYINGQEAGRFNVNPGPLDVTTRTPAGAANPLPISGPVLLPLTNVVPGDNVIAVVVIQTGATSSDIFMALELTAIIRDPITGPVKIVSAPQPQTVNEGQNATFNVIAEGGLPISYQWRKGGVDLPGKTNASLLISAATPGDVGDYSVFVSNSGGSTNSPAVHLTVTSDATAPTIVSAIGDTNLNVVTVTLNDALPGTGINFATAQDPARYQIRLTAGGGLLTVTSATATNVGNNTVVTLTTATPRTQGQDYTVVLNNVTDRAATPNAVSPNTAAIRATVALLAFDNVWRYDQSGTDLGTAWKESAYNDSAWPSGRGVLGFETTSNTLVFLRSIAPPDGTNTVLSLTNNTGAGIDGTNITFYFRTTVNVPLTNVTGATVQMRAYIDDGAIIYVNGIEQMRYNMTNGPGYTNLANAALTEPTPAPSTTFIVSNLTGLVPGANVIAVEVHQDSRASSDVDFGMQLDALVTSFAGSTTGPRLNISRNATTGQVTISWSGGGILQQANAIPTSGPAAWSDVPGNPNPYVFTPTPGQNRFFSLRQ